MPDRTYDVVLYGATGFAGRLTAEYLARHAPDGCRWAIAGRDRAKLERVRGQLAAVDPALASLDTLVAHSDDAGALAEIARSARVIATTVGPYVRYGEPLVAACAAAGTDYLDLTGEPEFVDTMYLRHHDTAVASGARLVHACGFDSVPHDLGAYYTLLQLAEGGPVEIQGYVQASAMFSGGTFASALTGFSRVRQNVTAMRARKQVDSAQPAGRRVHAGAGSPHHVSEIDAWAIPFPSLDPQIVGRSARALERYGPDFRYTHHIAVPKLRTATGIVGGVAGLFLAAQIPPARKALLKRLPSGEGPSEDRRARSWFRVTFVGRSGSEVVVTQVSGGDPGYDETAKMLAESALSLAFDDLPPTSGQVTTAAAMGISLIDRLHGAGIGFEVI